MDGGSTALPGVRAREEQGPSHAAMDSHSRSYSTEFCLNECCPDRANCRASCQRKHSIRIHFLGATSRAPALQQDRIRPPSRGQCRRAFQTPRRRPPSRGPDAAMGYGDATCRAVSCAVHCRFRLPPKPVPLPHRGRSPLVAALDTSLAFSHRNQRDVAQATPCSKLGTSRGLVREINTEGVANGPGWHVLHLLKPHLSIPLAIIILETQPSQAPRKPTFVCRLTLTSL